MTTTTTRPLTDYTDAERAEWRVHMDRVEELGTAYNEALREAGHWLLWSIRHPGNENFAREQADVEARKAADLWAERMAADEACGATAYGRAIRADIEARRAERAEAEEVS